MTVATETEFVIAWSSHTGPQGDANRGERFRASDPRVLHAPHLFVPDGTPEAEWPTEWDPMFERSEKIERENAKLRRDQELERARANPVKIETTLHRARHDFDAYLDGRPAWIIKGSVVHGTHPLALEYPDMFELVKR
jgi:hypothetical protein